MGLYFKQEQIHFVKARCVFLFFLVFNLTFGQTCDCEISKNPDLREKFKSACFSGNSKLFREAVAPIENDSSVFCKQLALYWKATFSIYSSNIEECKRFLDKEKILLEKYPCLDNEALYYNAQVNYFMHKGMLDSVVNACLKEQKIYEKLKKRANQATSLFNLSVIFSKMQQQDKRHFYLKKAVELAPEVSDTTKRANLLSSIAIGYSELSTYFDKKAFLDTALVFANNAIKLTEGVKNTEYIRYNALSVHQLKAFNEGDIKESIQINLQRKALLNPAFHVRDLYAINNLLAERYVSDKNYRLANTSLEKAKAYAHKLNDLVSYSWYKTKYETLKGLGRYDEALENYEHFVKLSDSVQQQARFEKINELETKYQTELKDAEILALNQQKEIDALNLNNKQSQIKWLLGLVAIAILTLLLILFYFRQRTLQNKQKILETEQRLNRARINPHFFFNAMASLQKVALQEKSPNTSLYTSKLAKIMRQSLESTYEEVVTLENEIDFLTHYLDIQKLRFPEKFEYEFCIDENLELHELKIPGMLMQPFIENAIEHGFKNIDYKGKLDITFKGNNNDILVEVEDNGRGLHDADTKKDHKPRATQIIKDRLFLYNKLYKANASYRIEHSKNTGFKTVVTLPKLY